MRSSLTFLTLFLSLTAAASPNSIRDFVEFKGDIVVHSPISKSLASKEACITLRGFNTESGWFVNGNFHRENFRNIVSTFCAPLVPQNDGSLKASIDDYETFWSGNLWDDTEIVIVGYGIKIKDGSAFPPQTLNQWVIAVHGDNSPDPWAVSRKALNGLAGFGTNRITGKLAITVKSDRAVSFEQE